MAVDDLEAFVDPGLVGRVTGQELNALLVKPAQVGHGQHRPGFRALPTTQPESRHGVVGDVVGQSFFVIAGQPSDLGIRARSRTQLGGQLRGSVNGGLGGVSEPGAQSVLAELGQVEVVAHQHDQIWCSHAHDLECDGQGCFVVRGVQLASHVTVEADLHVGQHYCRAKPGFLGHGGDLARLDHHGLALFDHWPFGTFGPGRRQADADKVGDDRVAVLALGHALPQVDPVDLADVLGVQAGPVDKIGNLANQHLAPRGALGVEL